MNKAPLSKITYKEIVAAGNAVLEQLFPGVSFQTNQWEIKHTRKKLRVMLPLDYSTLSYTIILNWV